MNAPAIITETPSPFASQIDWKRNYTPVFKRYFGNTDFLTEPHTYDELGARIVAEELADYLYEEYERCNRLGLHDMAAKADMAHFQLYQISEGEDDEAKEYARDCDDALDNSEPFNPRRAYGISQRDFL